MTQRTLSTIAREIKADWKQPYFGAVPYMHAMSRLKSVNDSLWYDSTDSGASIIRYFLSNASTWRGPTAKRIKAELKAMLKG